MCIVPDKWMGLCRTCLVLSAVLGNVQYYSNHLIWIFMDGTVPSPAVKEKHKLQRRLKAGVNVLRRKGGGLCVCVLGGCRRADFNAWSGAGIIDFNTKWRTRSVELDSKSMTQSKMSATSSANLPERCAKCRVAQILSDTHVTKLPGEEGSQSDRLLRWTRRSRALWRM